MLIIHTREGKEIFKLLQCKHRELRKSCRITTLRFSSDKFATSLGGKSLTLLSLTNNQQLIESHDKSAMTQRFAKTIPKSHMLLVRK